MSRVSAAALLVANLVVLAGTWRDGWGWADLLAIYWAETIIIGATNMLKMFVWALFRKPLNDLDDLRQAGTRVAWVSILLLYYFVGFAFLVLVLAVGMGGGERSLPRLALVFAISHGVSFFANYLGRGEFRRVSFLGLLLQPYARLGWIFLVFALGFLIARLIPAAAGSPAFTLSIVICKLAADLVSHVSEHSRIDHTSSVQHAPAAPPVAPPVIASPMH